MRPAYNNSKPSIDTTLRLIRGADTAVSLPIFYCRCEELSTHESQRRWLDY